MIRQNLAQESLQEQTLLPPEDTHSLQGIDDFLEKANIQRDTPCLMSKDGERIPVPPEIFEVLVKVAEAMSKGEAVSVAPVSMRLTTREAADRLGVSRQTLVRLLEQGEIPYDQPGRHRRIRLDDLLAYQRHRHQSSKAALDEMTRMAVSDGLYDDSAESYVEALAAARKE